MLGYLPAPPVDPTAQAYLYWTEHETLDGGPAGAILPRLQTLLDEQDAESLAAMVGKNAGNRLDSYGPFDRGDGLPLRPNAIGPSRSMRARRSRTRGPLSVMGSKPLVVTSAL